MKNKQLNSAIYTKKYYLDYCSRIDSKGNIDRRFNKLFDLVSSYKDIELLDLGCGNGDISFFLASKGANVIGIDYSRDAIQIALKNLSKTRKKIKNPKFYLMDATKMRFKKNQFDIVVSVDVFEHLFFEEAELVLRNISKIIKKNGTLLIHTEANKIYLNFTHRFYVYPMSSLLVGINKLFTKKKYPNLPKDPRSDLHKIQHVNEPTHLKLKKLFKKYKYEGNIIPIIPYKPVLSWKDAIFNVFVWLFPLSSLWPFHLFFAYDYICVMKVNK